MVSNCCEIFPIAPGLNHASNASDGTRNELRTGLKRTLDYGNALHEQCDEQ